MRRLQIFFVGFVDLNGKGAVREDLEEKLVSIG
jgi:hypothetical protein